jgi:hypothetical protein
MANKVCPTCKGKVFIINPDFVKWQKDNPKKAVSNFTFPRHIPCPACAVNKVEHPDYVLNPNIKNYTYGKEDKKK